MHSLTLKQAYVLHMLIATDNCVSPNSRATSAESMISALDATAFTKRKVLVVAAMSRADTDAAAYEFSHTLRSREVFTFPGSLSGDV